VQLGSRLDDNNEYKRVKYWASTVGAHDVIDQLCGTMSTGEFGVDISDRRRPRWVEARGDRADSVVQTDKVTRMIDRWCQYVTYDLEETFVAGVMAGYHKGLYQGLCVEHLKACEPNSEPLNDDDSHTDLKTEL
jgi:hypothetical protein